MTHPKTNPRWLTPTLVAAAGIIWLALTPARWARAPGAGMIELAVGLTLVAAGALHYRRASTWLAVGAPTLGVAYWLATHVLRSPFEEAPRVIATLELVPLGLLAAALIFALQDARQAPEPERGPTRNVTLAFALGAGAFVILATYTLALASEPLAPRLSVGYHAEDIEYPPGMPAETRSPVLNHSDSWSLDFPAYVGRYYYHCMPHDDIMNGFVEVTDDPQAPMSLNLTIRDFAFDTPEPVIHTGGTITWTNTGNAQHDVMLLGYEPPAKRGVPGNAAVVSVVALAFVGLLNRRQRS